MTQSERAEFITVLQRCGWRLKQGTIWAPSEGLWFDENHCAIWSLEEFVEIFSRRAERIRNDPREERQRSAAENQQASDAAQEVLKNKNSQ